MTKIKKTKLTIEDKRKRNNISAIKYRKKKKDEYQNLKEENNYLRFMISKYREKNNSSKIFFDFLLD